jgi:pyrrolidone-carboxylate peptidase
MFDQIYLTGFQKFGDHDVNPTELIAAHFAGANIPGLTSSVLEVTVEGVDSYIAKTRAAIAAQNNKRILNLHFGVGPNTVYKM